MTYLIYGLVFVAVLLFVAGVGALVQVAREMIDNLEVKPNDVVAVPVIGPLIKARVELFQ